MIRWEWVSQIASQNKEFSRKGVQTIHFLKANKPGIPYFALSTLWLVWCLYSNDAKLSSHFHSKLLSTFPFITRFENLLLENVVNMLIFINEFYFCDILRRSWVTSVQNGKDVTPFRDQRSRRLNGSPEKTKANMQKLRHVYGLDIIIVRLQQIRWQYGQIWASWIAWKFVLCPLWYSSGNRLQREPPVKADFHGLPGLCFIWHVANPERLLPVEYSDKLCKSNFKDLCF